MSDQSPEFWDQLLADLKLKTDKPIFDHLFAQTVAERDNGTLKIFAATELIKERLEHQWRRMIEAAVHKRLKEPIEIVFAVRPPDYEPPDSNDYLPDLGEDDLVPPPYDPDEHLKPRYQINAHGEMVYTTFRTHEGAIVENTRIVAPFVCRIAQKLMIYDEHERRVEYTLVGKKDNHPFKAKISAEEWADPRRLVTALLKFMPGKPPATDPAMRKYWGPAISALTDDQEMKEMKAIASTGWTPNGKTFVMPKHSVGDSSYLCRFDPSLAAEFEQFNLRPRSQAEQQQAVDALFDLQQIYDPAVICTILAHAFLPPLLRWVGDEARYMYHIHAETGSLKTELAKLIMGLYGPLGSAAITYKWSNTPIGAESRAHALKDVLMLIDDLKPGIINETDKARWVAFVQAAVDALGRKRAAVSGRASVALPPRALLLSTGEAIPEAGEASYTARMLLAELNRQPEGRNQQLDHTKTIAPLFSGLMRAYIEWLLKGKGQNAVQKYKQLQVEGIATPHARLANNFASNRLGAVMLAEFLQAQQLLSPVLAEAFLANHLAGLTKIVNDTANKAHEERYSQRFINGLRDAIQTGFAKVSDQAAQNRVGWQDDEFLYLLSGAKEIVDQWLRNSGQETINITKKALRKQIYDDGLSYTSVARRERGQYDHQATDPLTRSRPLTIQIYLSKFYGSQDVNRETGN